MTALVLGELKIPEPAPTTSCQNASCQYGVVVLSVIKPASPRPVITMPAVASAREP